MEELTKQAYLSFRLSKELFAVNAFKVLEVLEQQTITEIPQTPDYVLGVINFRGEILPVFDTRKKFNMPDKLENQKFVIIVLDLNINGQQVFIGTTADGVKDVIEIDEKEIKAVPEVGSSFNIEFMDGIIYRDNGFIMLLNVDKIFSEENVDIMLQSAANPDEVQQTTT
jgi:purine-binding chemotaxis protein CheW